MDARAFGKAPAVLQQMGGPGHEVVRQQRRLAAREDDIGRGLERQRIAQVNGLDYAGDVMVGIVPGQRLPARG